MRTEFAKRIKHHDWYYGYSDDHSVWRRGHEELGALRRMHEDLECPFDMKTLMHWAHNMVLEEFAEEEPGDWYRQPRKYKSVAAVSRKELITQAEYDEITQWMTLGSNAAEIADIVR